MNMSIKQNKMRHEVLLKKKKKKVHSNELHLLVKLPGDQRCQMYHNYQIYTIIWVSVRCSNNNCKNSIYFHKNLISIQFFGVIVYQSNLKPVWLFNLYDLITENRPLINPHLY